MTWWAILQGIVCVPASACQRQPTHQLQNHHVAASIPSPITDRWHTPTEPSPAISPVYKPMPSSGKGPVSSPLLRPVSGPTPSLLPRPRQTLTWGGMVFMPQCLIDVLPPDPVEPAMGCSVPHRQKTSWRKTKVNQPMFLWSSVAGSVGHGQLKNSWINMPQYHLRESRHTILYYSQNLLVTRCLLLLTPDVTTCLRQTRSARCQVLRVTRPGQVPLRQTATTHQNTHHGHWTKTTGKPGRMSLVTAVQTGIGVWGRHSNQDMITQV